MEIKDFLPKRASFYEYTWEVVPYMVMTDEGRMGPDIQSKTPNPGIGTEDMIFITWSKETLKQRQSNPQKQHTLSSTVKEVCYVSYNGLNQKKNYAHSVTNT